MAAQLQDVTGFRGEKITELCLTSYEAFDKPLFRLAFLGDKWPEIDYYVELTGVLNRRLYFFVQVKSTALPMTGNAKSLAVKTSKQHVSRLLQVPGPTYILGVHEPTMRVFARSIHVGVPVKAITQIPLACELNSDNLKNLHKEVCAYWQTTNHKPTSSVFI